MAYSPKCHLSELHGIDKTEMVEKGPAQYKMCDVSRTLSEISDGNQH